MLNLSFEEGVVPLEWKETNIIPLFKKGLRSRSENYRPVSDIGDLQTIRKTN